MYDEVDKRDSRDWPSLAEVDDEGSKVVQKLISAEGEMRSGTREERATV